jgi:hypothetical protein
MLFIISLLLSKVNRHWKFFSFLKYKTPALFQVYFNKAGIFIFLCNMSMRNDPSLHFNGKPEAIDSEGNERQEEPFDVVAEKLCARSVKNELLAVDDGVLCVPSFSDADRPRKRNAKGKHTDESLQNADADQS